MILNSLTLLALFVAAPQTDGTTKGTIQRAQGPVVSMRTLLMEMVDRERMARLPEPAYTCTQFSSYDRGAKSPDENWFANGDRGHFLRTETNQGREEWVMVDAAGPGAIVRIWSANPQGNVRIYVDGAEEPVLMAPMTDLLGGKWRVPAPLSAERSKGWNLYLPIPYAEHVKVTSDQPDFYYQVNVRNYAKGTAVESFGAKTMDEDPILLDSICRHLLDQSFPNGLEEELLDQTIAPGDAASVTRGEGPRAYGALSLQIQAEDLETALRTTVLEMSCDGEATIWCPVGDFFGSGVGLNTLNGWWRTVIPTGNGGTSGLLSCRWTMPYREHCTLTLRNLGRQTVQVSLSGRPQEWTWDQRSMYFHTVWRQENPIHTQPRVDWNYLTVQGQGVFVGDTLAIANPSKIWWGEGDEKIYVDGETFPSHFGTGTEDYYGYAWCSPELFNAPFHAQPRCDGPDNYGHTTVTRVRTLDAIPFQEDFRFDMEVWHWREVDMGYAATSHFYARPGATHNRPPQPEEAARGPIHPQPLPKPFRLEDGLECEELEIVEISEHTPAGPQGDHGPGLWSNELHLWVQGQKVGDFVTLRVPAQGDAPRRVILYATRSWDYAILRFTINGEAAGEDVDTFNAEAQEVAATGPLDLGVHTPVDGQFLLRAEVVGGHPRALGNKSFFGLDCVLLKDPKAP